MSNSLLNIKLQEKEVLTALDSIELTSLSATAHYIQVRFYGVAS